MTSRDGANLFLKVRTDVGEDHGLHTTLACEFDGLFGCEMCGRWSYGTGFDEENIRVRKGRFKCRVLLRVHIPGVDKRMISVGDPIPNTREPLDVPHGE